MISKITRVFGLIWVVLFGLTVLQIQADEDLATSKEVSIVGVLHKIEFRDANDRKELEDVLQLNQPISVAKDQFGGPVAGVVQVQLVVFRSNKDRAYLVEGAHLAATGSLFYPLSAHHHTKVLLQVKTLKLVNH